MRHCVIDTKTAVLLLLLAAIILGVVVGFSALARRSPKVYIPITNPVELK